MKRNQLYEVTYTTILEEKYRVVAANPGEAEKIAMENERIGIHARPGKTSAKCLSVHNPHFKDGFEPVKKPMLRDPKPKIPAGI